MTDWLTIATPSTVNEVVKKKQIISESEGGYRVSRALGTAMKRDFTLTWETMTSADKASLITFFGTYAGTYFNWTHPITTTSYVVRFLDSELEFNPVTKTGALYSVSVNLGEV